MTDSDLSTVVLLENDAQRQISSFVKNTNEVQNLDNSSLQELSNEDNSVLHDNKSPTANVHTAKEVTEQSKMYISIF